MNIGKWSFDQIVKMTFDQAKIKLATIGVFIALLISLLFSYLQSYFVYQGVDVVLYNVAGIVGSVLSGLTVIYVILNIASLIKNSKSKDIKLVDWVVLAKAILLYLVLTLIFVGVAAASWLLGFLVKLPYLGPYLMALLSVPAVIFFALVAVYVLVIGNMFLVAVIDEPKKSVLALTDLLIGMVKKNSKKIFFNSVLSLLPLVILALAGIILLVIGYLVYLALGWYFPGFAVVLSLSVQGGMNLLAFLINLSGSLLLAYFIAHLLVMETIILYSIYLDAK